MADMVPHVLEPSCSCMCKHMCVLCMCVYAGVFICAGMCRPEAAVRILFLKSFSTYVSATGPPPDAEAGCLGWTGWPVSPMISLSLLLQCWAYRHIPQCLAFNGNPHSIRLFVCVASTLATEPSLKPPISCTLELFLRFCFFHSIVPHI